jgi:hypothetical protein
MGGWLSGHRDKVEGRSKLERLFFLDSFVCNLNETYYHSSTVVERWFLMLALPSSIETFIIRGNMIGSDKTVCAPVVAYFISTFNVLQCAGVCRWVRSFRTFRRDEYISC